jgi:hypothetical protein
MALVGSVRNTLLNWRREGTVAATSKPCGALGSGTRGEPSQ